MIVLKLKSALSVSCYKANLFEKNFANNLKYDDVLKIKFLKGYGITLAIYF